MDELPALNHTTLTPLVRQALGRDTLELLDWQVQPLHGGSEASSRLYRIAGSAHQRGAPHAWSLILKGVQGDAARSDPGHWNYWKRELLAYQSGLLDALPAGLGAPRWFGVLAQGDDRAWLWLEELASTVPLPWPPATYGLAARHLGRFNGAYLAGYPLPAEVWLSPTWLRSYVTEYAPYIAQLPTLRDVPLIGQAFPDATITHLLALYEERKVWLAALERLPHTLCHRDAFPRNLFLRRGAAATDQLAAIDWTFVGHGPIGQELAPLVVASVIFEAVDPAAALGLEALVVTHYLDGLRDAGVQADPEEVQFGYAASAALIYGLAGTGMMVSLLLDEGQQAWWEALTAALGAGPLDHLEVVWHCADSARQVLGSG